MLSLPPRRSGPPRQPVCDGPYCLHLHGCRLGLRGYHFRGHLCVRLRYGLETRPHPEDEAVERLQKVGFPSPCSPSYRALAFPLVGLPPTEHASLSWTHNRACNFHCTRLSILVLTSATYLVSVSIRMTTFRSGTQGLSLFPSASDFRPCYHVLYLG